MKVIISKSIGKTCKANYTKIMIKISKKGACNSVDCDKCEYYK